MDDEDRHVIAYDIATAEFGGPIEMSTYRAMGQGLYESRSNVADSRISRVFFCVAEEHMVLLYGMIKKAQATPKTDLDIARKRMKEARARP